MTIALVFIGAVALAAVAIAALGRAPWSFRAEFRRDVAAALAAPRAAVAMVTEADLAPLPAAVQRYLRFVGVVGKPRVWNYRVRFRGRMRNGPGSAWMRITARQRSFVEPAARLFYITASMLGVPAVAYHRYVGPSATFRVRLLSLLTVVDAEGPEMDRGETVTLFNDMCLLAPATLIDPGIAWQELDPERVRATFTNAGHTVAAELAFDESGALVDFTSDDRSRTADGKRYERLRWSTPVRAWRDFGGVRLAAHGDACWDAPAGRFAYAEFDILSVEYNTSDL